MATAYFADNYSNQNQVVSDGADFSQVFSATVPAAGFIINDTVALARIPAGVIVLSWFVDFPALDSGTAVRIQLGVTGTASAFMAATLEGGSAAGTFASSGSAGVLGYLPKSFTAQTNFLMTVSTAATGTTTAGTIKGWVRMQMIGITPTV